MNLPDLASHLPGPRDKHVPAFASWLAGLPRPVCGREFSETNWLSGRQWSPFWAPESPACRATGNRPHPHPRPPHTRSCTRTRPAGPGQATERWPQGRELPGGRTGGQRQRTLLWVLTLPHSPPAAPSSLLSVTSQSSAVLCSNYPTIFNKH